MRHVLVTIARGIIEQVIFFYDPKTAVKALAKYVKVMNVEHNDAAVYGPDGFVANAKYFLDENDQYFENSALLEDVSNQSEKPIYIIGNPRHPLGFMVTSPDDPLGYQDPAEALSELSQMRKDFGIHLKLYQVIPVNEPVAHEADLKSHNEECSVDDFDYELVREYLF